MADNQEVAIPAGLQGRPISETEYKVLHLSSDQEGEPEKRVPLFYIDDVEYTVVENPSPTIGLRYLHILGTEGEGQAAYYLLSKMLGEEGYEALMTYDKLTQEQYDQVLDLAVQISTGGKERPKVRPRPGYNGPRR
jgi:hypothetical protein